MPNNCYLYDIDYCESKGCESIGYIVDHCYFVMLEGSVLPCDIKYDYRQRQIHHVAHAAAHDNSTGIIHDKYLLLFQLKAALYPQDI